MRAISHPDVTLITCASSRSLTLPSTLSLPLELSSSWPCLLLLMQRRHHARTQIWFNAPRLRMRRALKGCLRSWRSFSTDRTACTPICTRWRTYEHRLRIHEPFIQKIMASSAGVVLSVVMLLTSLSSPGLGSTSLCGHELTQFMPQFGPTSHVICG